MDVKTKVLFVAPSMRGGGTERVILNILKGIDYGKFEIILALVNKEGPYLSEIPKEVNVIDLNAKKTRYAIFKIVYLSYSLKPKIIFSFLSHLNILVGLFSFCINPMVQLIARESIMLTSSLAFSKNKSILKQLFSFAYKKFDTIVCQSEEMKLDLADNFNVCSNTVVIPNPVDIKNIRDKLSENNSIDLFQDKINLISVGRLEHQKGYDFLLQALSKLDDKYCLTILGKGSEEDKLKSLANELKIAHKVSFKGYQKNPYHWISKSDIFVMSSRYEGFPNVILEALVCNKPVVSFDCPGIGKTLINDGKNGYLAKCGDLDNLSYKIIQASKTKFHEEYFLQKIERQYSLQAISQKYSELFDDFYD